MKTQLKVIFTSLLLSASIFFSCSDNSTEPETQEPYKNYFPNKEGSLYKYDIEITDSSEVTTIVERTSTYSGTVTLNNKVYQILVDQFVYPNSTFNDSTYFRKTDSNVFYYADISGAFSIFPDSVISNLLVEDEAKLLSFPMTVNDSSQVYKLIYLYNNFPLNVINVYSNARLKENVSLTVNGSDFNKEAIKVEFTMTVILDISHFLKYVSYAWFVEDVGLVKLEGDSEAINFMIGYNLFDAGSYIKQTLKQYSIP
jgi:hypothetical protein